VYEAEVIKEGALEPLGNKQAVAGALFV